MGPRAHSALIDPSLIRHAHTVLWTMTLINVHSTADIASTRGVPPLENERLYSLLHAGHEEEGDETLLHLDEDGWREFKLLLSLEGGDVEELFAQESEEQRRKMGACEANVREAERCVLRMQEKVDALNLQCDSHVSADTSQKVIKGIKQLKKGRRAG